MKVEELSIGDWVIDGENIAQITSITCDGIIETTFNEYSNIEAIEPIPLTPEILEKNGFVYNNLPFVQAWEQNGLSIYGDGLINCGQNVSLKCQYVHQLQHILRDCDIDKEIELGG